MTVTLNKTGMQYLFGFEDHCKQQNLFTNPAYQATVEKTTQLLPDIVRISINYCNFRSFPRPKCPFPWPCTALEVKQIILKEAQQAYSQVKQTCWHKGKITPEAGRSDVQWFESLFDLLDVNSDKAENTEEVCTHVYDHFSTMTEEQRNRYEQIRSNQYYAENPAAAYRY